MLIAPQAYLSPPAQNGPHNPAVAKFRLSVEVIHVPAAPIGPTGVTLFNAVDCAAFLQGHQRVRGEWSPLVSGGAARWLHEYENQTVGHWWFSKRFSVRDGRIAVDGAGVGMMAEALKVSGDLLADAIEVLAFFKCDAAVERLRGLQGGSPPPAAAPAPPAAAAMAAAASSAAASARAAAAAIEAAAPRTASPAPAPVAALPAAACPAARTLLEAVSGKGERAGSCKFKV